MSCYLVTGATGFVGGRLVRQLRAAGHRVRALVRRPGQAADLGALGIELAPGDITDRASVAAAVRGVDGVYHLAAWYRVGARDSSPAHRVNVEGTRNVLLAMRDAGVPRGVYTSSLAVFGDTHGRLVDEHFRGGPPFLSVYDRTKWLAHYEVALPMMKAGLPLVIVQPGVIYGPGDHSGIAELFRRYLARTLPLVPKRTAYCWGHVEDMARAHVLAMEKGRAGGSYIIAGPPHSLEEALAIAQRLTGIAPPAWRPGPRTLRALAAVMRVPGAFLPLPLSLHPEALRVLAGATYLGDNAKARRELGVAPRPLAEGLEETLAALQAGAA